MKSYLELEVWKYSRVLVSEIHQLTKSFPREEIYGLVNQMRRSSISIPSNIAEGCGRNHKKESIQFFYISRGSLYELETQILLSFDQNYCTEIELNQILEKITTCKKLLNGFVKYYETII